MDDWELSAPVQAEETGFAVPRAVTASPYEYARSGAKAERAKTADAAGTKVIGGEVAAEGAWPWQVALTVANMPVKVTVELLNASTVEQERHVELLIDGVKEAASPAIKA